MKKSLLVVGSVAFDSLKTRAGNRNEILGGAATYISLCACHFTNVNLVGVVGNGDFPQKHIDLLTSHNVDLAGLEFAEGRTFRWSGEYSNDFSSRETLDTQLGVFETFDPKIPDQYKDTKFLLLGNINPSVQLKVLDSVNTNCYVVTDTMNLWINIALEDLKKVIAKTNLLVINDEESAMLTGELQVAVAAQKILKMGPQAVIIKRGEHGAYLFTAKTTFFAPAFPLENVVDPTGAGDSFAGGLAGYMAGCDSFDVEVIKKGMIYGTAIASATCEDFGVEKTAIIEKTAIENRFSDLRKLVALN